MGGGAVKVKKIDATPPLKITRDGDALTLTKGDGFDAWLAAGNADFREAYVGQVALEAIKDWLEAGDAGV
jgi:hypothetical protein